MDWCDVQDEILAEDEKFVLRVEDLLSWVAVDVDAAGQRRAPCPLPSLSDDEHSTPPAQCNFSLSRSCCVSKRLKIRP